MKRISMLLCAVAIMLMGYSNNEVKVKNGGNDSQAEENNAVSSSEKASGAEQNSQPVPAGYVDLGLSVYWKNSNEWNSADDYGFYTYDDAVANFGSRLPTREQLEELEERCTWTWSDSKKGYYVKGPNGNSIFLPAVGFRYCSGNVRDVGTCGTYWSSTPSDSEDAWYLGFDSSEVFMGNDDRCLGQSVRLVQGKEAGKDGGGENPSKNNKEMGTEKSVPAGYVDLGLSVYWKNSNEWNSADDYGFYTYDDAVANFGSSLPTKAQLKELRDKCTWTWNDSKKGYDVKGPNGNTIFLPAAGGRLCNGDVNDVGTGGIYWLSTPGDSEYEWYLFFYSSGVYMNVDSRCYGLSVRLVQGK